MLKIISNKLEGAFGFCLALLRRLFGARKPATLITYRTYGDDRRVKVMARVVESFTAPQFSGKQKRWDHFVRVVKLFSTTKIAGAKVSAVLDGRPTELLTNSEGFVSSIVTGSDSESHEFDLKLDSSGEEDISYFQEKRHVEVHRPSPGTQFLVVSDIDDTILKSRATSFLRLALRTLFEPLSQRQAFPEVANYYKKLQKGKEGRDDNLFFYVSSSTWNIYPLLTSFLKQNLFPLGPIILQDVTSENRDKSGHSHYHKFQRVSEIAEFYPQYPLVLIGDAGQKDAQIYLDIIKHYPKRVKMVLIRHSWWTNQVAKNQDLLDEAKRQGVPAHYFHSLDEVHFEF